jgi:ATP-binding cassette subfamily B protein
MVVVYLASALFYWLQDYLTSVAAARVGQKLRQDLFNHLQKLPLSFFDKKPFGEVMSRLTNDITTITQSLSDSLANILSSVLSVVGSMIFMFYLSPIFALVTLLIVPLTIILSSQVVKKSGHYFKQQAKDLGALNAYIEEMLAGQKTIQAFTHEAVVIKDFESKNTRLKNSAFKAQLLSGLVPVIMGALTNLNFVVLAVGGGYLAIVFRTISVGVLTSFIQYSNAFTRPLAQMANQLTAVQQALAGAQRVFEILDEPAEKDLDTASALEIKAGKVEFSQVNFSYDGKTPILENINFIAQPGQTIALVGATGSGKTTIISLLERFYAATSGQILIDEVNINNITLPSLRSQIASVLQDTRLFAASIADNIRFGNLKATDEEVEAAAKLAHAHHFIELLPHGYQTKLTADGGSLSAGERQLLAIARAILAQPKILILDEATANIDTLTEQHIQKGMARLKKNRTTFMIAHRLSTVKRADLILVVSHGKIVEQGTHAQLLAIDHGFYATLYNSQFGGDFDLLEET